MHKQLFVLVCYILTAGPSGAETLYDFACCPNDDCQRSETDQISHKGGGWYIRSLDEVIGFDDPRIRPSRDGQFHICTRSTATPDLTQSRVSQLTGARTVKCLYVPSMS